MGSHVLRNKHSPEELRARLKAESFQRTTLSFYRYVRISDPIALRNEIYAEWDALHVLGRIYLAAEGINAQLSVPTHNFEAFRNAIDARPEFAQVPFKIAVEDDAESFIKLTIKVRPKLVAHRLVACEYSLTPWLESATGKDTGGVWLIDNAAWLRGRSDAYVAVQELRARMKRDVLRNAKKEQEGK